MRLGANPKAAGQDSGVSLSHLFYTLLQPLDCLGLLFPTWDVRSWMKIRAGSEWASGAHVPILRGDEHGLIGHVWPWIGVRVPFSPPGFG